MTYVALYCRISRDKAGRVEGVRNQEKWGRDYAAAHWPDLPVTVFSDNDISASNGDDRPGFEALRTALASGEVAHLWTVEQSRLERREAEWFRLAAELDAAGISEVHTKREGVVRVRDEVAGIKAVINAGEVRKMVKRINDRLDANAAKGLPAGSRPYGYVHGVNDRGEKTLMVVEAEAEVIRESAERILAGWSLTGIARDLIGRGLHGPHRTKVRDGNGEIVTEDGRAVEDGGVPLTQPSTITRTAIRSWVTNASTAGKRVHQGRIVGAGNWAPILDEDTWNAVRDKLAAPRSVERADGGTYLVRPLVRSTARRYLLTGGLAVCGVCTAPLIASMKQLKGGARVVPYYLCHPNAGGRGCIGIMADPTEAYVVALLLDELDKPEFLEMVGADTHAGQRDRITTALRAVDGQRNDLARMWAARELTAEEWRVARAELTENEQRLRVAMAAVPPPLSRVDPALIREGWDAMTLDERREILTMFIASVTVVRATPGLNRFDANRITIAWR